MNKAWKITGAIIAIILFVVLLRGCVMTSYLIPSSGMENSLFQGAYPCLTKSSTARCGCLRLLCLVPD